VFCQLLLGRTSLFDNHVIYDRYANTYAFKCNGHSLILAPLPPPKRQKLILEREMSETST